MTHQPSCLQCKQADRDCVSSSRLSVAALSMCSMPLCDCWCLHLCPSCRGGRHCVVCSMCQIWALNLDHHSAILQGRRAWEEEGVVFQPGTSPPHSSVLHSLWRQSLCLHWNPHIFVTKRQHATLTDCGAGNLSHCVFPTHGLILVSSRLTFITVLSLTNCMVPTTWPAAELINMTSACFVRLSVLWPDQVQY